MNEQMIVTFSASIDSIVSVNSSFDKARMHIAYHGENRNKMVIPKAVFDAALPTMPYCPIVCTYDRDSDTIGGHDQQIVRTDKGIKLVRLTTPVGVVPADPNVQWEWVTEDDGSKHEYQVVDVLLWKRQEAYEHIRELKKVDQSMEMRVTASHKDKETGLRHIDAFEYTAFCLLESETPCFESAGIELFSVADASEQFKLMMEDMKKEFNLNVSADEADSDKTDILKGGDDQMENEEIVVSPEVVEENPPVEPVAEAPMSEEPVADEPASETADPVEPEAEPETEPGAEPESFSLTANQLAKELRDIISAHETYVTNWKEEMPRYWYIDHDSEVGEVYVHDCKGNHNVYGMPFGMNGDKVVVDFDNAKRKKCVYVDFVDGEDIVNPIQEILDNVIDHFSAEGEKTEQELSELRNFKKSVEDEQRKAAVNAVFARFTDLNSIEQFNALKENYGDMSVEDVEEKCFALRGRYGAPVVQENFSVKSGGVRMPAVTIEPKAEKADAAPYGGIVERYTPRH